MTEAQFEMLGDIVDLDIGLDADLAPHADDRLNHLEVLGLVALGRLDRELGRLFRGIAAGGQQLLGKFGS